VSTRGYTGQSERPILVANPRPETLLTPPTTPPAPSLPLGT
jgi:hypothetical protein